ncbi:MAG: thiamine phosphate synthase [Acidobacteriota bacterium]|nr:thiamine phosphate synthase [Acidobacteriota bacterium]MDQ3418620.1 thiamine phosphate synthase [Acidobacteriota bacterium]
MSLAPPFPSICIVTRGRGTSGSDERLKLVGRLAAAARAGADMIQIRERHFDDRVLLEFAREVIEAVRPLRTRVLINERTDIALASGADGVHLKSDGPRVPDVRRIVPDGFLIGRSVHAEGEARAVQTTGGCDYLFFGTVFRSASKPDNHPLAGLEGLRATCASVALPVIAIGGMSVVRVPDVRAAGAGGIAAISLFAETPDIAGLTASIRDALTPPAGHV